MELPFGQEPAQEGAGPPAQDEEKRLFWVETQAVWMLSTKSYLQPLGKTICPKEQPEYLTAQPSDSIPSQFCGGLSGTDHSNLVISLA